MNHRYLRRALILAAAVASTSAVVAPAIAQYRIDNSQARDANNRIGSNGYNGGYGTTSGGLNGNLLVTGNVGNGRSFRGALGYTDPSAFRGNLGSAAFDNFNRDSVGVGQLRAANNLTYANQSVTTARPYFGAGRTVATPAGFVQDSATGGYVLPAPQVATPYDGRLDYGGATRAQVARGSLLEQPVIGGAGLASNGAFNGFDQRQALGQSYSVSEFTQLGRPAARIGLLEQNNFSNGLDNGVGANPRDPNAAGNAGPASVDRQSNDPAVDNRTGLNPSVGNVTADPARQSNTATPNGATPNGATPNTATPNGNGTADATRTGQGIQIRDVRAIQNNPQYAALRNRLDAQRSKSPGQDLVEQSNRRNQQVLAQRAKAAAPDAKGTTGDAKSTPDASATPTAQPEQPNATSSDATPPRDALRLPRLANATSVTPAPVPAAPADAGPVEIKSLATGVKNDDLRKTLGEAETLMRAGKFTSAIDAYDRAQSLASDDPLVFTGRGIAELGGGYYRNAETHLRQAFTADRSLLLARFDLRELLTNERLNFLVDDLGRVANADKTDPGPLVLLAFVYYNTNLPDRAAKALDLAQQRAGNKDEVAKMLRENWTLPDEKTSDLNK